MRVRTLSRAGASCSDLAAVLLGAAGRGKEIVVPFAAPAPVPTWRRLKVPRCSHGPRRLLCRHADRRCGQIGPELAKPRQCNQRIEFICEVQRKSFATTVPESDALDTALTYRYAAALVEHRIQRMLTFSDVVRAYRQAKSALLEERSGIAGVELADFEAAFGQNIRKLHRRIKSRESMVTVGEVISVPKAHRGRHVDVQLQLLQSVESAVCDVLWLWRFGAALERLLDNSCTSNRLKANGGQLNKVSRDLYRPWNESYSKFHADIRQTATSALETGTSCVIATFDIKSFYNEIDTRFLLTPHFVQQVRSEARAVGESFDTSAYLFATRSLLGRYARYQSAASEISGVRRSRYALPIGAVAARLIANLALADLDRHVLGAPQLLHYARWVDDIVAVVETPRPVRSRVLMGKLFPLVRPYLLDARALGRPGSRFELHRGKVRTFFLQGEEGLDLLASVSAEIDSVGSYRGAFGAALDRHEQRAELLEIVRRRTEVQPGAFQYVDGVKVRRAAASALIAKSVEAAQLTLGASDRADSAPLRALARTLAREMQWVDFVDMMARALGAALINDDAQLCSEILATFETWIAKIEKCTTVTADKSRARHEVAMLTARCLRERVNQVLAAGIRQYGQDEPPPKWIAGWKWSWDAIRGDMIRFRGADLRVLDREDDFHWTGAAPPSHKSSLPRSRIDEELAQEFKNIARFLVAARASKDPVFNGSTALDVWLSRRPPSVFDISWRWIRSGRNGQVPPVAVINSVRGTRYQGDIAEEVGSKQKTAILVGATSDVRPKIRFAFANMQTTEEWFKAALMGRPHSGRNRILPVVRVVNAALRLRRKNEHLLLVMPEVSVPRATLRKLVRSLSAEGIGLVAGLEYERRGNRIMNEAVAVIPCGFGVSVSALWRKTLPAVGIEADEMRDAKVRFERSLRPPGSLVIESHFGALSVLICSELLEIRARSRLVGRVDAILVPCWNKDTVSFEQVIQGAALDIHCFVGIANNAEYSDARLRGPAAVPVLRDLCRLIERNENSVVSAIVDIKGLREFQQKKLEKVGVRPPNSAKPEFKPVPPGFKYRRPEMQSWWRTFLRALR